VLAAVVLMSPGLPLIAQENNTYIQHAVRFAVSPPLRELAKLPQRPLYGFHIAEPARRIPRPDFTPAVDPVEQRSAPNDGTNYSIGLNLLGLGNGFPNFTVPYAAPDTNMAVGDSQVVQWVNIFYTVCSKTTAECGEAIAGNTLWSSLGGNCAAYNDIDITAQWDVPAHRWLLSQPAYEGGYAICVAVSTSSDATGSYYLYEFPVVNGGFPDYPKWGNWPPNQWAQTWNNFGTYGNDWMGPVLCIYDRPKLLDGDRTAEQICHQYPITDTSLLPADTDSRIQPPAGEAQFAIGSLLASGNSKISLYTAQVNNPADWSMGATFTGDNNSQTITVAPYNIACAYPTPCVPQKGITDVLEGLGDRLMYRFAYWADQPPPNVTATPPLPAPAQHWLTNHTVVTSSGNAAIRWYEFTAPLRAVPVTSLNVFQQGTYSPDGTWRWMGSIARDKVGDILVGYSKSCGDSCPGGTPTYPSVFLAGRKVNDPLGLGQLEAETMAVAGTGSQPDTGNRWGDYSAMRLDTNDGMDGCTFWFTQEFYQVTQATDWSTQITSAKFSNCN